MTGLQWMRFEKSTECARCGAEGKLQAHHWAPRHLFPEDADEWPISYLCRPCHLTWHKVVTPGMWSTSRVGKWPEDLDATEWAGFLQTLRDEIGGKFTAAEIARTVEERVVTWRDVTPSVIVRKIGRPELAKVIGEAFAQRVGRRWDDGGLRLERVGHNRQKVAVWSVVTGDPAANQRSTTNIERDSA